MQTLSKFDKFYVNIKQNRWFFYFSIFCRVTLAWGFIMAGMVKIFDERFASGLSTIHPMGAYLEALHHTGYYYTFIGIAQVAAAVMLLIPRTVTLGALLYFPIILNICILSLAVRFEGSHITSPMMVLANLYILIWNYDKIKYILPFKKFPDFGIIKKPTKYSSKFPILFFLSVFSTIIGVILFSLYGHEVMPRNSLTDCKGQFIGKKNEAAGAVFCECIHAQGNHLEACLEALENAKNQ